MIPRAKSEFGSGRHESVDLRQLIMAAQPSDLAAASDMARLIEQRGFNRSRNLVEALLNVWQEFRTDR